jgi:hypothetical protein
VNWRLFSVGLALAAGIGVNVFLGLDEQIAPPDARTKVETRTADPLFGMQHTAAVRQGNFQKMGFSPEEVQAIVKVVAAWEQRWHVQDPAQDLVGARIEATEDSDGLVTALCGTGSSLPVRYAAMGWLLQEQRGALGVVNYEDIPMLKLESWARTARVQAVYEDADLAPERKEDSVKMAMAAILARDEQTLLEHASPWGRAIFAGWSWEQVQKKHPGVQKRLYDYVAVLHLTLEVANREGGLCAG